jgi:hypothetical protein
LTLRPQPRLVHRGHESPVSQSARKPSDRPTIHNTQLRNQDSYRSALRANPFPEVTDLFCRLPLPTLFYRLEAVHLGDLMRLWVRPGVRINLSLAFSRAVKRAPDTEKFQCFPNVQTLSPVNLIPGSSVVKKKRQLFPGLVPTSTSSQMLPYNIHVLVKKY